MAQKLQKLPLGEEEYTTKYKALLDGFMDNPDETNVYVPFQNQPNSTNLKINTIEIDGHTLYHGLSSQSTKGVKCIPIFTDLDEIQPSYGKYFKIIPLPISRVVELITKDSSAQGLMLDMFSLNIILDKEWIKTIKEANNKK